MTVTTADVCVVGGGPAGAITARALAQLGYRTCVVAAGSIRSAGVIESLPASGEEVLTCIGLWSSVAPACLSGHGQRQILWQSDAIADHADNSYLVDRRRFDDLLIAAARDERVTLVTPARVRRPIWNDGVWTVPYLQFGQQRTVTARYLVDATGRRANCAPLGKKTIALCGKWEGWSERSEPQMSVEAGQQCWFWAASTSPGAAVLLAFVDASDAIVAGRPARIRRYLDLIDKSRLARMHVDGLSLIDVRVRDATSRIDNELVSDRMIRVGDRAFAMDPLSSQGLMAAIRSGLQAARVINTILGGGDAGAALEFYRTTLRSAADRHLRHGAAIYASQALYASEFWSSRSSPSGAALSEKRPLAVCDGDLRVSPTTRIVNAPVLEGDMVERHAAVVHPSIERPIAWLGGLPLARLVGALDRPQGAGSILELIARQFPQADARAVLAWMIEHEILVAADTIGTEIGKIELSGHAAVGQLGQAGGRPIFEHL